MATKHAFIDTNVLLSYYEQSDDTLNELEKLNAAAKKKEIVIYTNRLLFDEMNRNRETRIQKSLKNLRQGFPTDLPRIAEGMEKFGELVDLLRKASKMKQELLTEVKEAAENRKLHADGLINDLLKETTVIEITDDIIDRARLRTELANPPGKSRELGDRIHWEALLAVVPEKTDLILVSRDQDFCSPQDESQPRKFLVYEWMEHKTGELELHRGLAPFLKAHFPDIKVPEDFDRKSAVEALVYSGSFQSTHKAIAGLNKFGSFSDEETGDLLHAALGNSQVSWILYDDDVAAFYLKLIDEHADIKTNELAAAVKATIEQDRSGMLFEDDDDPPF